MKKIVNLAFFYGVLGLFAGLFYREYTKYMEFEGSTMLSVAHTHLLAMGMIFMLLILCLVKLFPLNDNKWFKRFLFLYNVGFIVTITMMFVRGVFDVQMTILSSASNGMISGIAGLGHMSIAIAIVFLFMGLKSVVSE